MTAVTLQVRATWAGPTCCSSVASYSWRRQRRCWSGGCSETMGRPGYVGLGEDGEARVRGARRRWGGQGTWG